MLTRLFDLLFGWIGKLFGSKTPKALPAPDIEVEFSSHVDGLTLRVDRATMLARVQPMVQLTGVVTNSGERVVRELSVVFHASRHGVSVGRFDSEILGSHQGNLRPGDSQAFDVTFPVRSDANGVVVTTDRVDVVPFQPVAAPVEAMLDWQANVPVGVAIVFRERLREFRPFGDGRQGFCHLTLEVDNQGQAVSVLKLEIAFFDAGKKLLDQREVLAAWTGGPPIHSGERRLVHVISKVPSSFRSYSGAVVDVV